MNDLTSTTIVAVPVVNAATNDGVITALSLEQLVFAGMTGGAWFKVGMGVALVLLVVQRGIAIYKSYKGIKHESTSD